MNKIITTDEWCIKIDFLTPLKWWLAFKVGFIKHALIDGKKGPLSVSTCKKVNGSIHWP